MVFVVETILLGLFDFFMLLIIFLEQHTREGFRCFFVSHVQGPLVHRVRVQLDKVWEVKSTDRKKHSPFCQAKLALRSDDAAFASSTSSNE